jgi:hypothetical protein
MNIKPLYIETVFAGFIHLIWITLLSFCILEKSPDVIFCYLSKVDTGITVLLFALLFSVSFFLGRIAEHFLIAANYLFSKKKTRQAYVNDFKGASTDIWGNKIFTLSSFIGLLFSGILLLNLAKGEEEKSVILIIGGILCLVTLSSFIYWFCFGRNIKSVKCVKIERHWLKRLTRK